MTTKGIVVAIVCTDRGQHEWTSLGDLVLDAGHLSVNQGFVYGEVGERRKGECVYLDDHGGPHMSCPRCRRHLPWKRETAVTKLTQLNDAGATQLDISLV